MCTLPIMDVDSEIVLQPSELQVLIEFLQESSADHLPDILNTDPHPSDHTLSLFAKKVYTEKDSGDTAEAYGKRLDLPEGWRLLVTGSNSACNNGYFGAAFVNTELQQLVVAHRGTVLSEVGSLYTDYKGIFGMRYTICMNSAVTFVDTIRLVMLSVNSKYGRSYNLTITGHSLGGWLAQVTAFTVKWVHVSGGTLWKNSSASVHAKTVAFDSPGAKGMLDKLLDKYFVRYGINVLDRLDITVYVSAPNRINTCGAHVGTIYRVFIDLSVFRWEDMDTALYNSNTHAINNFVEAFKITPPNIKVVMDWAKNRTEYNSLFEDQTFNQTNNYHVDLKKYINKYLDEISKHYRVDSPPDSEMTVEINLNAFSEDEVKILHKLIIINEQRNVSVLNEFLLMKQIPIENSPLFPDFKFNHINQTIICKSKQLLKQLTCHLKQLMRWLGPEFTEAVENQIRELTRAVDLFYHAEEQSYLQSIPKSLLNFKDSIGLRDFLLSPTDHVLLIVAPDGAFEMIRLQNIFSQIKQSVKVSDDPINKYITENHYFFLDFPRLQKLSQINDSPINLMMVDGSSSPTLSSEIDPFLKNFVGSSYSNLKKLVLISSHPIYPSNSLENIKIFKTDHQIDFTDLSNESQESILQKNNTISIGNRGYSFREFLGENCRIHAINQFVSSDYVKNIAINKDHVIVIKDTRPLLTDLQMPLFKTNIKTSLACISNCIDLSDTLVVMSGLNRGELETEARWEQLKGKICLAEGDAECYFKDKCNKNQLQSIFWLEVSGGDVFCKQIFDMRFNLARKFIHRTRLDLQMLAKTEHDNDLFVICSEEDKNSLLRLISNCKKREEFIKNVQIAVTKEEEVDIVQKHFNKNIHFMQICRSGDSWECEWRYSHGSMETLRPCVSQDFFEPINELTLSQTKHNLVIITDEPGMGKTTSLARLSWLIKSEWVIYIQLRDFQEHLKSLSDNFTPRNVASFLLSECCTSADDRLTRGLLEYLLESKMCSRQLVLMFDGLDEVDNFIKEKDIIKAKLVRLFAFLVKIPTVQLFLTSRKYLKELLKGELSQFSTSFVPINEKNQRNYLFAFWRSCLSLELEDYGEEEERRLEGYAAEVLRQAKRVIGLDMDRFMGVPLQLRMLAEVFRPQSNWLVQPTEVLFKQINILSAPNLYKRIISMKHEIYLDKTLKREMLDELEVTEHLGSVTKKLNELGFRTFFSDFYEKHCKAITAQWLGKLNSHGVIQSKENGEFQFVHQTYAEYCCIQMVVHWLNQESNSFTKKLIKEIFLPRILLHPDSKVIRLLFNVELENKSLLENILQLNAGYISQLWLEDSSIFRNQEHQTALHIAVLERNEHIVTFLLNGFNAGSTSDVFVSFITQYDLNNNTALNIVNKSTFYSNTEDGLLSNRIMRNILQYVRTCSDESLENVLFACLFNRDISESYVSIFFLVSGDTSKVFKKVVTRTNKMYLVDSSFMKAVQKNNVKLVRKILFIKLKNKIERYCFLLTKKDDTYKIQNALHTAVEFGHLDVVKLLAEKTPAPFTGMMAQRDVAGRSPLHIAVKYNHLHIVKYLVEHGADINARCRLGESVLMYAANREKIQTVKYLVESGANINSICNVGRTVLHAAAYKDCIQIVEYLLQLGVDLNRVDREGYTALTRASLANNMHMMQLLLERGADINADGGEVLFYAIRNANWSVVEILVNNELSIYESRIPVKHLSTFKNKFPHYKFKEEPI